MKSRNFLLLAVVCAAVFCVNPAHAADGSEISSIVAQYQASGTEIAAKMLTYATSLFWILAAIQFAGSSIRLGIQGADFQEWTAHLVRQIFFIGIYAWLMEHSYEFSLDIVQSFRQAGSSTQIMPGNVFTAGLRIAEAISQMASSWNPFNGALVALCCVVIVLAFVWVSGLLVVALCEMYLILSAAVLMTGFGGSEWTRDLATKSFMLALGIGAKLLVMELILSTGWGIIDKWASASYAEYQDIFVAMAVVGVFVYLVQSLPNLAQQVISGAATGSTAAEALKGFAQAGIAAATAAVGGAGVMAASGALGEGAQSAISGLGQSVSGGGAGGSFGPGASAASDAASAAQVGGDSGNSGSGGGAKLSPAGSAGAALGQIGRAVAQNAYGRMTGTGIHGGTLSGRLAAYMVRNNAPPPPSPQGPQQSEENSIS
ncbi:P-type conjugative transfer protein TrbL [Acetobacter sp. AAB5]|uniref:P-type conjugative transfer protein TrbL n=1 Tax=Acetobacter sp. AAB5 TaxID=3418370 RepID=UPI003CF4961A